VDEPEGVTVKVLLNLQSRFLPYTEGDRLFHALEFVSPLPNCGHMEMLLMIVFEQLNIPEPTADWAIEYRAKRNRSLSVGDVVVIGEQAWACEPRDWKSVSVNANQVWYDLGRAADDA